VIVYFEAETDRPWTPGDILSGCVESGAGAVLLDEGALPGEFFDLSSGLAGELLHKLSTYRLRLAGVVPDPSVHPTRFQEFLRESNLGTAFRFFRTRGEAVAWLEA
jgi:hypothetical protein